jgi:hypothetical protein
VRRPPPWIRPWEWRKRINTHYIHILYSETMYVIKHIYNLGKRRVAASISRRAYILLGSHWDKEELKMHHFFNLSIFVRFIPMFIYIYTLLCYIHDNCQIYVSIVYDIRNLLLHWEPVYLRAQSQEYVVPPIPIHIPPLLHGLLTVTLGTSIS